MTANAIPTLTLLLFTFSLVKAADSPGNSVNMPSGQGGLDAASNALPVHPSAPMAAQVNMNATPHPRLQRGSPQAANPLPQGARESAATSPSTSPSPLEGEGVRIRGEERVVAGGLMAAAPSDPIYPDTAMEEGKMLYNSGLYMAALSKFMAVLRQNPTQPVARHYLQLLVDAVQKKPAAGGPGSSAATAQAVEQDTIQRLRQWALLTMDLVAIPGVRLDLKEERAQVELASSLLFADKTGGLKEEAVPILDRIAAWLKSYGQRSIAIHCYPEETEEAAKGGSLFLDRYAELYGFFVEERGIPAQRFVSSELLIPPAESPHPATSPSPPPSPLEGEGATQDGRSPDVWRVRVRGTGLGGEGEEAEAVSSSTLKSPHVVIAVLGSHPISWEGVYAVPGGPPMPHLLELGIMASRTKFNPEDGEWTNLDLAALHRKALSKWSFKIMPAEGEVRQGRPANPGGPPDVRRGPPLARFAGGDSPQSGGKEVYNIEGKGNLLERVSWDGRDQHSGSFVPRGVYICKLAATSQDGALLNREITLIVGSGAAENLASAAMTERPAAHKKARKHQPKTPPPVSSPSRGEERGGGELASANLGTATAQALGTVPNTPVAQVAASNTAPHPAPSPSRGEGGGEGGSSSAGGESVRVIWKQVVQFEANDSDLKPSLKASLERIGKTLDVYPLQKVRIVGFAASSEAQPAALAQRRAQLVRNTLVNEYQVPAKKVAVAGSRVIPGGDAGSSKVEMSITN